MERKFTDLHIYSNLSIGQNSIADIIKMAESLGLSSICIIDYVKDKNKDNLNALRDEIIKHKTDIKIYTGIEVSTDDPEIMRLQVKKLRDTADIIIVSGGNPKINRVAVENPRVDILAHPELGRKDSGLDNVMAKLATENGVAIELNFKYVLNSYRKVRSHLLSHMRTNVVLAKKYKTPLVITSGAESIFDMRAGRELASIGSLIDLELAQSLDCISQIPENIINHAKKVKDTNYIMPGVEVINNKDI
ncbi:MAG: PHP domain-containing protein [DPANN group archaeon]|nr:PHP domain-containing protein [DPANN group archaeon]